MKPRRVFADAILGNRPLRFMYDLCIIGGGIVGLATAYQYSRRFPHSKLVLLEKEPEVAAHQTGHNSGVIHSGIYYKTGSFKARLCAQGKRLLESFCAEHGIPFEKCGKIIVATHENELPALQVLLDRGHANGIPCRSLSGDELRELEPHVTGIKGIHIPSAGIVSFTDISQKLCENIVAHGADVFLNQRVTAITERDDSVVLKTAAQEVHARAAINCAGLHSDKILELVGVRPSARIVPFRGEYYLVKSEAWHLCRNLIYPVPDPRYPFLGVHFTRMIHGGIECGPNAVLAFAREGYKKNTIVPAELFETLTFPGFQKLALRHWKMGLGEMYRSFSRAAFVRALKRLVPEIEGTMLSAGGAGVRAQAVDRDGKLVDDFLFHDTPHMVHVLNAPSPAATSSLAIGSIIVNKLIEREALRDAPAASAAQ